jgi:Domain of Unknown Function (DUF930)
MADQSFPVLPRALCIIGLVSLAGSASAQDQRFLDSLRHVEPDTRLEQVCDYAVMSRISRDTKQVVDRAKSDVTSPPSHLGDSMTASGGAFRSNGKWYSLDYACKGTPDHLHVTSLQYKIGGLIPESKWPSLGLWR